MTVSSTPRRAGPFNGNGVTTAFPFAFKVFAASDLQVTYVDANGNETVLTSQYSVALNADQDNNPGGAITYPLAGAPLAVGESLTVTGDLAAKQGTDITNLGRFLPQVFENALDYVTILCQQLLEKANRALTFPVGDSVAPGTLPTATQRAGKFLAFDAGGQPIPSSGTGADAGLRTDLGTGGGTTFVGFIQAGLNALARSLQAKLREPSVSVTDYAGCDPTGATASDNAFVSALTYIASLAAVAPAGVSTNRLGNRTIKIPAGVYVLNTSGSMLNSALFAARTGGLTFEGDGPAGSVVIIYDPAVAGPMLVNNDKVLNLRFKNILFHGKSAASNLMDSASTGGAQDYVFEDCVFSGTWQYGINLTGTNVNSEMKFDRCGFYGSWLAYLYSAAAGTSDQFLNYWFHHCKYWCSSPWIDMSKGGSIKITDSDVSGYQPGGAQSYLFNLRGNAHSRGVTSFSCKGVRFEQKTQYAGIIYCEWEQGAVAFTECDFGSQAFNAFAPGVLSAHFAPGGAVPGTLVKFDSCTIMGVHRYTSVQPQLGQGRATYENCEFLNYSYPDDAITFATTGGQIGRKTAVRLRNCRGSGTVDGVFADAEVGWNDGSCVTVQRKLVSLKTAFGALPRAADGAVTVILPLNALITRMIIDVPAGAVGSAAAGAGWSVATSDGVALGGLAMTPYNAGGSVDNALAIRCSTRARSTVVMTPNVSTDQAAGNGSVCLIEYIG